MLMMPPGIQLPLIQQHRKKVHFINFDAWLEHKLMYVQVTLPALIISK